MRVVSGQWTESDQSPVTSDQSGGRRAEAAVRPACQGSDRAFPPWGEGAERSEADEGAFRQADRWNLRICYRYAPLIRHPASVRRRMPPSPRGGKALRSTYPDLHSTELLRFAKLFFQTLKKILDKPFRFRYNLHAVQPSFVGGRSMAA